MSRIARQIWAAALVLVLLAVAAARQDARAFEQCLVPPARALGEAAGGIGLGAAAAPSWSWRGVDMRVERECPCVETPVPGGACYCADHGLALSP